mmetsp:Transcript_3824/g.5610  ORF Transcript_3824/g.5610 Transcript_3824/m.5610 type:complete len:315 (-) Transcript_3824:34-978(-)|eukprot:CAMPEP_0195530034 /NCGR_PEP_ID=MMETSP0794_2-20130614/32756_1 /TAXON_ID=515487 /ORGANISM="Stephanopyxis turris, Strain CCMP 815" /LENGTH=314 /DNA_ID=CAMNT_0040661437 /DNA_START=77 /DNA_END=1021 /DNA_ORIENTATION=+
MSTGNSADASSDDANQLSTRDDDEDSLSDEDHHNNGEQDEEMMIDHCSNDMGPSQDPRSFMDRFVWCETDVRFFNDTNREVLFIIADEEFKLERSTKFSINDNGDDGDDDNDNKNKNISGLIPLSASTSTSMTKSALKSRCMPLAPRSNSSQHFSQERLTYVTALTKDQDGEGRPWTRIHYENKVINCKRTKSLKFLDKHLRIIAYRIAQQQQQPMIIGGGSEESISEGIRMRLALSTQDDSKKRIRKMGKATSKKRITMPMTQPDHPKERIIKKGKAVITRRQSKRISLLSNHNSKSERTTKKGAIVRMESLD